MKIRTRLFWTIFCLCISTAATANQAINESFLSYNLIDLNDAPIEKLMTLKGVGQKKAQAIIDYRMQHNGFRKIEELTNVKGIGDKILKDNLSRLLINSTQGTLSSQPRLVQEIKPCITPNQ